MGQKGVLSAHLSKKEFFSIVLLENAINSAILALKADILEKHYLEKSNYGYVD